MQVVILGATMYGMEQAVMLANQGHQVLLTTALSYPGEDLLGTFRAYTDKDCVRRIAAFTEQAHFANPADIKAALLKRLRRAGIVCAYYTRAVAPLLRRGQVCGILLAGPTGMDAMPCDLVLDATLLQAPSFQITGIPLLLKKGTPLPVRTLLTADTVPETGEADLFDPQRFHMVQTAMLPEDMTPTAAQAFLMDRRSALLRQLRDVRCDSVQPAVLDTALTAPETALPGWLRRNDPVVLPEQTCAGAADSVLLMGNQLPYDPQKGLEKFHADALGCREHDVLVCGGGTAGVWAALSAAEHGAGTLVIESRSALGGTRTHGGVAGFYCGNRNGLFQDIWERIRSFTKELPGKGIPHPVTEALYLNHAARQRNMQVRLDCQIFRCFVEDRRIVSVMSVGEDGLFADRGIQTVDGTGEGLLCVLAGCDAQVGDPLLQMTQNCSQWRRCTAQRRAYSHRDQDVILPTERSEWMRCTEHILLNTQEYDLYPMLATRESRRIRGRNTVTLRSVSRGQRWTDTIYDAYSTFDPHGRSFCTEGRLGALPALGKGRFAAVPLGALLPAQLDGVFVTGKAISASQEGANFLRMNPDVMSIGWIAGKLAADCVKQCCDAPQLDLKPLQAMLLEKQAMVAPAQETQTVTAAMLLPRILAGEDESVFNDVVLARPEGLGEMLARAAQNKCFSKGILLDMCRMLYHDTAGAQRLITQLETLNEKNGAIVYSDRQRDTGVILGGVHGAADDYWQMNRLVVLLCEEQCRDAIPAIGAVLANTVPGGGWENPTSIYSSARLDSNTLPNYDRILCLAHGISIMPDPIFLPELTRLLADVAATTPPAQQIWRDYLVLRLIRAAVACGGDAKQLLAGAKPDTQHAIVRNAVAQLM